MKLISAEETLKEAYSNHYNRFGYETSVLKNTYLDVIKKAMLEHSKQAVKYALEVQAGKAILESCNWKDKDCAVVDHESNPLKIDKSSITNFDYSQIK